MNNEFTLYRVGGSIRNQLLDREYNDEDFVIIYNGDSNNLQEVFDKSLLYIYSNLEPIYIDRKNFRAKYKIGNGTIDVCLSIHDGKFNKTIYDDLKYRDCTIDAMAMTCDFNQTLIDPFNGYRDIQMGYIRPTSYYHDIGFYKCLKESPIRILRYIRLCVLYDFELSNEISSNIDLRYFEYKELFSTDKNIKQRAQNELNIMLNFDPYKTLSKLIKHRMLLMYICDNFINIKAKLK